MAIRTAGAEWQRASILEKRDGGWSIHRIDLDTKASSSDMTAAAFEEHAQGAKKNVLIPPALSGVDIGLRASSCQFQRPDICVQFFVWRSNPAVTSV